MELVLIAAVAKNGVIGCEGHQPWSHPLDRKRFFELTAGHSVIMGWNTFVSIGQPLKDRRNIIVSSRPSRVSGAVVCASLEEAMHICESEDVVFVIGGGQLFSQTIDSASRLEITHVHHSLEGDVFFPEIDASWKKSCVADKEGFSFVSYVR